MAFREFRLLWAAQVASELGDWAGRLALAVLVQERTGSTALTALVTTVSVLPYLGVGQLLATLADRFPRRRIIVATDVARAALFAAMAIPQPVWMLFVLALAAATLTPLFEAARNSLTIHTVPAEHYGDAIAVANITFEFALLVGFAAGGGLATLVGAKAALLANAASFLVSAAFLSRLAVGRQSASDGTDPPRLREGWRAIVDDPFVLRFLVSYGVIGACAIAGEALVVPYAREELQGGAGVAGALAAAMPLGAILATVYGRVRGSDATKMRRAGVLAAGGAVVATFGFAFGPAMPFVFLPFAGVGVALASRIPANEVAAPRVPDRLRGSAFTILQGFLLGGQALSAALAGLAARSLGVRPTLIFAMVIAGLVGIVAATSPPAEARHAYRPSRERATARQ
jgi:predicted MFS family arabinose efflux permease